MELCNGIMALLSLLLSNIKSRPCSLRTGWSLSNLRTADGSPNLISDVSNSSDPVIGSDKVFNKLFAVGEFC